MTDGRNRWAILILTLADFLKAHIRSIRFLRAKRLVMRGADFFIIFWMMVLSHDAETRHLVSSTRFVFNYVNAYFQTVTSAIRNGQNMALPFLKNHRHGQKASIFGS